MATFTTFTTFLTSSQRTSWHIVTTFQSVQFYALAQKRANFILDMCSGVFEGLTKGARRGAKPYVEEKNTTIHLIKHKKVIFARYFAYRSPRHAVRNEDCTHRRLAGDYIQQTFKTTDKQ
jgi:hypothetical protein